MPPKEFIREIRINQNPFSAEYDSLGIGRIEIFTKPGSDKFHGNVFFNIGTDALDARPHLSRLDAAPSAPLLAIAAGFFFAFRVVILLIAVLYSVSSHSPEPRQPSPSTIRCSRS